MVVDPRVQRAGGQQDPVPVSDTKVSERGSRYIDFVVPGLLGMNLMGSGIWASGSPSSTREEEAAQAAHRNADVACRISRVVPVFRLSLLVIEVATLIGFGALVFGVPLRGSLIQLAIICVLSSLAFGGLGLLIAARPRTIEGASGLMNLVMLPMWVFSGVFFSSGNFPKAAQPFIQALPLTAVNDALRANMLQGASWGAVGGELAIIVTWLVVCFVWR
jgi:ABC-type polysaccharide/polyol phosphate export permease